MTAVLEWWSFGAAFVILVGLREVLAKLLSDAEKLRLPADDNIRGMTITAMAARTRSLMIYRKPDKGWRLRAFTVLPLAPALVGFGFGFVPGMPVAPVILHAVTDHGWFLAPSLYFAGAGMLSTWFTSVQVVRRFMRSK